MTPRFLGTYTQASIVLCDSSVTGKLKSLGQMKKAIGVKEGFFRKSDGHFRSDLNILENAHIVSKSAPTDTRYYHRQNSTDYFVTPEVATINIMTAIKSTGELLVGFHVDEASMKEIDILLENRVKICHQKLNQSGWIDSLVRMQGQADEFGISDPTVVDPDVESIKKVTDVWGNIALTEIHAKIVEWTDKHKWKMVSGTGNKKAISAKDLDTDT